MAPITRRAAQHPAAYAGFKAGAYNQNNTGDADDHVKVTFFALERSH